ncbi:hypothetical protein [Aminobacter sp. MET-1]|uniref:hypothetical protein n=1 Tax=Aminobacter sp. MET-1 TaxID=2951085 RepID=UPI00226A049B|nr:hypothetical protein [Aminobacter sp. MET-1]MCX8571084.1 hypothetical protein [Aminobacter sp. MET-1]MCX8573247.1 hypothetical protein [Aminobacter sp. MET-1]
MIVYNVKRRWFDMKGDAEKYRVSEHLPPADTIKVTISDRSELAALLNALCEPPPPGIAPSTPLPVPIKVIDMAFVDPDFEIPKFLRDSWARLLAGKGE